MIPVGYLQIRLPVMSDFSKLNEENDTKVTLHEIYYRTCVIFLKTLSYAILTRTKTTLFNNNILSTVTSLGKYEPDNSLYDTHDTFMSLVTTCKRQSISRKK